MAGYLGIDIGGTASRWAIVGEDDKIVARGVASGATGHLFNPAERERFESTLAEIGGDHNVDAVQMGVTGLGPPAAEDMHALVAKRFGIAPHLITSSDDMELSYRAVFGASGGHLIAAGTGSIGLHILADGERIRVGGRGMLIDDGGSGTWIVLTALDRLYRRIDETGGPGNALILAERLFASMGGSSWDDVRSFVYGNDRGRIGSLAQTVASAAGAGDPLATDILHDAVVELARLAHALIARVGAMPVAFIGGIIDIHPAIRMGLKREMAGYEVDFPRVDAALYAARMARQRAMEQ